MKKVALVTGANKGIGLETSRQLARKGMTILMGARSRERGLAAATELKNEGLDVLFVQLDVTKEADIEQVNAFIKKNYGKLDVLVNNAGIIHQEENWGLNNADSVSAKVLKETFEVNFFGLIVLTQSLLPLIKKSTNGYITNVSSILASSTVHSDTSSPWSGVKPFAYNASKTALNAFTVHLASILKDTGIKVNSAHPGWVKTDLGTDAAPMGVVEGAKTVVDLSLEQTDFSGKYMHLGEEIAW